MNQKHYVFMYYKEPSLIIIIIIKLLLLTSVLKILALSSHMHSCSNNTVGFENKI